MSAGYFAISQIRRASRRRRAPRRRDLRAVRNRQVGGPLPYPLRVANRRLGRGSRGVLPVRMGSDGTASTRIVRPTALGSFAVGWRPGSLQRRPLRRHGLRHARHACLRPRVARGAGSCRLPRHGGVAGAAPQAVLRRFLRPAETAAALRRSLSHEDCGNRSDHLDPFGRPSIAGTRLPGDLRLRRAPAHRCGHSRRAYCP